LLAAMGLDLGAEIVNCQSRRTPGTVVVSSSTERWSSEAELSLVGQPHRFFIDTARTSRELVLRRLEDSQPQSRQLPAVQRQEIVA